MKIAEIYSIPIRSRSGFGWKWRSADGQVVSRDWFIYFYDCLSDARKRGYHVELKSRRVSDTPVVDNAESRRPGAANDRPA